MVRFALRSVIDVILPRDASIARTMLSQNVCPSVTRQYSIETAKHIIRLFSLSGGHSVLVFLYQTAWHYSEGDPLPGR